MADAGRNADQQSWREQRRDALAMQEAALQRARSTESAQARSMLEDFVAAMRAAGARPHPLRARVRGRSRYRTGIVGWYLRENRTLGVDVDGAYYILGVPPSLRAAVRGVSITPSPPPLQIGRGARDGESISLERLLQIRLDTELRTRAQNGSVGLMRNQQ